MKFFLLLLALIVGSDAALNCYVTNAQGVAASTECADGVSGVTDNSCTGPTWTDYTGYNDRKLQCGAESDDDVCVTMAGDDANDCTDCTAADCNKPAETVTFKCMKWTWSSNTWSTTYTTSAGTFTTCTIKKTDEGSDKVKCNKPAANDTATDTYAAATQQCGPCVSKDGCTEYTVEEYECTTYTWSTDKWTASAVGAGTTCIKEKGSTGECTQPTNMATKAGFTATTICGACATTDENCSTVNGVTMVTMSFLLLTLTALLHL